MKIFFGIVALIFALISVVSMLNDRWAAGFLFLALSIVAIHFIPQERGARGWIGWFE